MTMRDILAVGIGCFFAWWVDALEETKTIFSQQPVVYALMTLLWILLWFREVQRNQHDERERKKHVI